MNLARAIGPAVAGLLIAQVGVVAVFALNAASFAVFALVLAGLPRRDRAERPLPEHFAGALVAGGRFVRHSPTVRRMLLRTLLFAGPGAALWALLPLVASRLLGLDSTGYGLLLAALGVGAVVGALVLPRVTARLSPNRLVLAAGLVFACGTVVSGLAPNLGVVLVALFPAGMAWLSMLATMNGTLQVFLPGWVRARGLSIYLMVFAGGQAVAALAWGLLAELHRADADAADRRRAARRRRRQRADLAAPRHAGWDRSLAVYWPEPHLVFEPELEDGPVVVIVTHTVAPERAAEFRAAMELVRRTRLRTGAQSWGLYRDGAPPRPLRRDRHLPDVGRTPAPAQRAAHRPRPRRRGGRARADRRRRPGPASLPGRHRDVGRHVLTRGRVRLRRAVVSSAPSPQRANLPARPARCRPGRVCCGRSDGTRPAGRRLPTDGRGDEKGGHRVRAPSAAADGLRRGVPARRRPPQARGAPGRPGRSAATRTDKQVYLCVRDDVYGKVAGESTPGRTPSASTW